MEQRGFNLYANIPAVTKNLIIINVLFWFATIIMSKLNLTSMLGLHYPVAKDFRLYQFIAYMFMHGSFSHLFFNMFAVYMFGRILESVWGPKRFLTYYMITGIGAGLINILVAYIRIKAIEPHLDPESIAMVYRDGADIIKQGKNYSDSMLGQLNILINSTTVGASGAVFGILLAFGMLFPNMPLFIIPFPFPIKAKYLVVGYGLIEFFAGVVNFSFDNVAHFAHLGGMLFGVILVLYWRKKDRNNGRYFY
ncbi:MAG: rhomboid family intramembrane serine protease [Tannerella sp.]|jgi:membrane associated rhomboid family serine protease|nr:rhomboid family intramembrane serine protease [Tannerella sp.]